MNEGFFAVLLPSSYLGEALDSRCLNSSESIAVKAFRFDSKSSLKSFLEAHIGDRLAYTDVFFDGLDFFKSIKEDLMIPGLITGDHVDLSTVANRTEKIYSLSGTYFSGENTDCSVKLIELSFTE